MKNTNIEWCDHTFNPWRGCQKVSDGCKFCYAKTRGDRYGEDFTGKRVLLSDSGWKEPLKWQKKYLEDCDFNDDNGIPRPRRPRVFCASLGDVFEDWDGPIVDHSGWRIGNRDGELIPCGPDTEWLKWAREPDCRWATMDDVRKRLFELIDATPHLDWLLVTKRPENIRKMWRETFDWASDDLDDVEVPMRRENVWLLTSVENQEQAEKRIPELLRCRDLSPVLGLSCEPLLGPIDLFTGEYPLGTYRLSEDAVIRYMPLGVTIPDPNAGGTQQFKKSSIDWIIAGGESGINARPMNPDWARSLRDQCNEAEVPFFFKQHGEFVDEYHPAAAEMDKTAANDLFVEHICDATGMPYDYLGDYMFRVGKKKAGRLLDGKEYSEFPEVQRAEVAD